MDVEPSGDQPGAGRDAHADVENPAKGPIAWLKKTNRNPDVVALIRRARTALPGDPDFGDPLSVAGDGGAQAAARAADRILRDLGVGGSAGHPFGDGLPHLQGGQSHLTGGSVAVTIVFTDLVGFSDWSLQAGDEATLRLLRRVAQVAEPPFLDAGGQIVKRMGDGIMVVFQDAVTAVRATIAAREAVKTVEVDGYTPRVRAGIHTGRPQRIGGDWLGVDVNIAARVMERATRGGLIVSENTLQQIPQSELEAPGVTVKRVRRQVFTGRQSGVPADLVMYRLKTKRDVPGEDDQPDGEADRPD